MTGPRGPVHRGRRGDAAHRGGRAAAAGVRGQGRRRGARADPSYVATLRQRALREGTAALVRPAGRRPPETGEDAWERARAWRAQGVRDAESRGGWG
ncbi:MAG TPA: hypothetical protein VLW50_31610 [Streptosporangiaceae bacterium]|nr:hypothetical protein [Streptosporangiaceae bacterium]